MMKDIEITSHISQLSYDELAAADRQLVDQARKATFRSYAPYSRFSVGAAIRLSSGDIATGSNQENAAFPSGLCAERTACYHAHSQHPDQRMEAIAIAARGVDGEFLANPISPCGACRQALIEYETLSGKDIRVLLVGASNIYIIPSVKTLLPLAFTDFG